MNKPRLLFVVESPFGERDHRRFGVDDLRERADVFVLDIHSVVRPQSGGAAPTNHAWTDSTVVGTLDEAIGFVQSVRPHYAILNLGAHPIRAAVITAARACSAMIVEFQLGALPEDDLLARHPFARVWLSTRMVPRGSAQIRHVGRAISRRFRTDTVEGLIPDAFIYGGTSALNHVDARVSSRIAAHSFDCELFRCLRDEPRTEYRSVVYLDQEIGFHPDYSHDGLRSPAEPTRFYADLRSFLARFSDLTGLPVVIAIHPRAESDRLSERFGAGVAIVNDTPRAVRDSSLVLGHTSTALSFAVLWSRPILLLTSRDLRKGWYAPLIRACSSELGSPTIDMSRASDDEIRVAVDRPIDETSYASYRRRYLTTNDELQPLWPTALAALEHAFGRRAP